MEYSSQQIKTTLLENYFLKYFRACLFLFFCLFLMFTNIEKGKGSVVLWVWFFPVTRVSKDAGLWLNSVLLDIYQSELVFFGVFLCVHPFLGFCLVFIHGKTFKKFAHFILIWPTSPPSKKNAITSPMANMANANRE